MASQAADDALADYPQYFGKHAARMGRPFGGPAVGRVRL